MADLGSELTALRKIHTALERFDEADRMRLLRFVLDREGEKPLPPDPAREGLRGREIGDVAIAVLRRDGRNGCTPARAHYRDWFDLMVAAGYRVAGKNACATFLTNLARHPLVESTTEAGIYRVEDEDAA